MIPLSSHDIHEVQCDGVTYYVKTPTLRDRNRLPARVVRAGCPPVGDAYLRARFEQLLPELLSGEELARAQMLVRQLSQGQDIGKEDEMLLQSLEYEAIQADARYAGQVASRSEWVQEYTWQTLKMFVRGASGIDVDWHYDTDESTSDSTLEQLPQEHTQVLIEKINVLLSLSPASKKSVAFSPLLAANQESSPLDSTPQTDPSGL